MAIKVYGSTVFQGQSERPSLKPGTTVWHVVSDAASAADQAQELHSMAVQLRLPDAVLEPGSLGGNVGEARLPTPRLDLYGGPAERVLRWIQSVGGKR